MSWLDKAKVFLGILDPEDLDEDQHGAASRSDRPSLAGIEAAPQQSLEDALTARQAGDLDRMRQLLREMDRGSGLRTVIRAAAALEAEDEGELNALLPIVRQHKPPWKLLLQTAAALDDHERAEALRERAATLQPPNWAMAWCQLGSEESSTRHALVELLFADPGLAKTIAARELDIEGIEVDSASLNRYTSFSHGRDCIEKFGAPLVADLLDRAAKDQA